MTDTKRTAAIVLAAGASSRMGRNKMLEVVQGESVVRRAVRTAIDAHLAPVIVVLGHQADVVQAELRDLDCITVINPDFTGPTSTSVHAGLGALADDVGAAVIILADMVLVSSGMLSSLVAHASASHAPLVASRYGTVQAPPLLVTRPLFGELLAYHGDGVGRVVMQQHRAEAVFVVWPEVLLTDIDTPDDLRTVHALHAGRSTTA